MVITQPDGHALTVHHRSAASVTAPRRLQLILERPEAYRTVFVWSWHFPWHGWGLCITHTMLENSEVKRSAPPRMAGVRGKGYGNSNRDNVPVSSKWRLPHAATVACLYV